MSTMYEERQGIIQGTLPQLIESLTNFQRGSENFELCEQFALCTIKYHKFLSINSHSIKRKMEGLFEKLYFDNKERFAVRLREIYENMITDPICLNHEESEIHWSIICFLLKLSRNPVGALNKKLRSNYNFDKLFAKDVIIVSENKKKNELIEELKTCNFEIETWENYESESTLSDWSTNDDDDDYEKEEVTEDKSLSDPENGLELNKEEGERNLQKYKPPVFAQQENCITFDCSQSEEWLHENIQKNWWSNKNYTSPINSAHASANFCNFWNQHLSLVSNNYIKIENISTISEYCLIREILWMFLNPCDCKVFKIVNEEIVINSNVSLNSTTVDGFRFFLTTYTKHMTIMFRLKKFCSKVMKNSDKCQPSHTYECYAMGVESFLRDVSEFVIKKENIVLYQRDTHPMTVISLLNDFSEKFKLLDELWELHKNVILDWQKFPAHICSAHLLCSLFTIVRKSGNTSTIYVALSLFVTSLKIYLTIMDTWWTEGKLHDMRSEFLVNKTYDESQTITGYNVRLFAKSKQHAFYISSDITKIIESEPIFQLFLHHSLEAGYTLNILYILDRMNELKRFSDIHGDLYDLFLKKLLEELDTYQCSTSMPKESVKYEKFNKTISADNLKKIDDFRNDIEMEMEDDTLFLAMGASLKLLEDHYSQDSNDDPPLIDKNCNSAHEIYLRFYKSQVPSENIITRIISNLLSAKMPAANRFVTTIFRDEFHLLKHLRYIRCVLLLEGSDLMYFFYNKLFQQIESGENWANPYLLTTQLNHILCSKFPDMSTLFTVHLVSNVRCKTQNVLDAIDQIQIIYGLNSNLRNLITPGSLEHYIKIFQFLLKVNWGLWSLENLRFPDFYKKRLPYAQLNMLDLKIRRLTILKFWMIFAVQSIHTHLMTLILQNCGKKLDDAMNHAKSFKEMLGIHENYIATIFDYSFQHSDNYNILTAILQLLNLVNVLRELWMNMYEVHETSFIDTSTSDFNNDSMLNDAGINELEKTYIRCHEMLANALKYGCYKQNKTHLSGLCSAFNYSMPH